MTFGEFLNSLAAKARLQNDPQFIQLLASADLSQRTINDELAHRLDGALMSLEGAKNNTDVQNHFRGTLLKTADEKFATIAEKFGLTADIAAEKSTYKKFDILETKLAAKIAELEKQIKEGNGTQTEEVKNLQTQIATLQAQAAKLTADKQQEIEQLKSTHQGEILNMLIRNELAGKNYANKQLDNSVNVTIASTLLTDALKKSGAIVVNENGAIKLKNAASPNLDYYDDSHKAVGFGDYVDKLLADNKLLEVSKPGAPKPPTPQPGQTIIPGGGAGHVNTEKVAAAIGSSLADLGVQN
jgi:hypothetical protein